MAEQDKGFSFRSLFFRNAQPVTDEKQAQPSPVYTPPAQGSFMSGTVSTASTGVSEQSLVEDFVQRLQNLINQNNQPGFDFLEFTESR
jgi:hypothetical protein